MRSVVIIESFKFAVFVGSSVAMSVAGFLQPSLAASCSFSLTLAAGDACDTVEVLSGQTGTVSNSGAIGDVSLGFGVRTLPDGAITSLTNIKGGTITGNLAILNSGSIGALTNGGSVIGGTDAISGSGSIDTLTNSASITGGIHGIYNFGSIGTLSNSGTLFGAGSAIVVTDWFFGSSINVILNSGTISSDFSTIWIQLNSSVQSILNTGTISSTSWFSILLDGQSALGTIQNDGYITSNLVAIDLSGPASITSVINNGTITAGAAGVSLDDTNSTMGSLVNRGTIAGGDYGVGVYGTLSQLTNDAGGLIQGATGVWNEGTLTRVENSGSILGGTDYGLYTTKFIPTVINNAGGVIFGPSYGIYVDGGGIGTFVNGQGGDGLTPTKTALTYYGALPGNYYIQVTSATQYGQLAVRNASGAMNIGVVSASGGAIAAGRYHNVLSGVDRSNLANTSGMIGSRQWLLELDGANYDLLVGADAANTRIALQPHSNVVARLLAMRSFVSVLGLEYDCQAFSSNNFCLSFQTAYSAISSQAEGSGILVAAVRADPSVRIGASIDLRAAARNTALVKYGDLRPALGIFAAYDQFGDGAGFQARIAGNMNNGRVELKREASLPNTEAGHGVANHRTNAISAVLGYGVSYGGFTLTPRLGLRRLSSVRGAYSESDDVGDPIYFSAVNQTSTSSIAGLNIAGQMTRSLSFHLSAGADFDFYRNAPAMSGASSLTGMNNFTITSQAGTKRARPYAQGGLMLALDEKSSASIQVDIQNPPFSVQTGVSTMAGYRRAF